MLSIPVLLVVLALLWVMLRISRHSRFSLKVSGLGVKVELTGGDLSNPNQEVSDDN